MDEEVKGGFEPPWLVLQTRILTLKLHNRREMLRSARSAIRFTVFESLNQETSSEGFEPPLVALETIVLTIDTMSLSNFVELRRTLTIWNLK